MSLCVLLARFRMVAATPPVWLFLVSPSIFLFKCYLDWIFLVFSGRINWNPTLTIAGRLKLQHGVQNKVASARRWLQYAITKSCYRRVYIVLDRLLPTICILRSHWNGPPSLGRFYSLVRKVDEIHDVQQSSTL